MFARRVLWGTVCTVLVGVALGACGGSSSGGGGGGGGGGGTDGGGGGGTDGGGGGGTDGGGGGGTPGTWTSVNVGASVDLYGIWGSAANNLYVVGPQTIRRYNGTMWASGGDTVYTLRGCGGGSSTGFAVGVTVPANGSADTGMGITLRLTGSMPTEVTQPTPTAQPALAWGRADNDIWAVGGDSILHWNGSAWADFSSMGIMRGTITSPASDLYAVWGAAANDVRVVGRRVYHYDGTTFTEEPQNAGDYYYGIWGSAPNNIWMVGSGVARRWNGTAWSDVRVGTLNTLRAIWGSAANDIWAVGDGGTIIHYDGTRWASVQSPTTQRLRAIWGSSGSDVWAVGEMGAAIHYVR